MTVYTTTPAWSRAESQLDAVLARFDIPASFLIRAWSPNYFDAMCALSSVEGWTTPELRPKETLAAWENSWPTLVAVDTNGKLVGFLRAITDTQITTYLCELLVVPEFRRLGLGKLLIDVCQGLVPTTRLDLLSTDEADDFYQAIDCADFQGFRRHSKEDTGSRSSKCHGHNASCTGKKEF